PLAGHPDHRERPVGDVHERWHAGWSTLRLVDGHIRDPEPAEQLPGSGLKPLGEPGGVPKLDGNREIAQSVARLLEHRRRVLRWRDPWRELEKDGAELAALAQRLERVTKDAPDLVVELRRQILRVDTWFLCQLRRQRPSQVRRKPRDFSGVP